jgi:hypothetical protein
VKANRAYRLLVRRGGRVPAFLADSERVDHVEVVEIDTGEVAMCWDLDPRRAARLARTLRSDLAQLDPLTFIVKWEDATAAPRRERGSGRSGRSPGHS